MQRMLRGMCMIAFDPLTGKLRVPIEPWLLLSDFNILTATGLFNIVVCEKAQNKKVVFYGVAFLLAKSVVGSGTTSGPEIAACCKPQSGMWR